MYGQIHDAKALRSVFKCLDRGLVGGEKVASNYTPGVAAVGLDTNALKQLRRESYLTTALIANAAAAKVPIIIPGQSIEEFWNNHRVFTRDLEGIERDVSSLSTKVATLLRSTTADEMRIQLTTIKEAVAQFQRESEDARNPQLLETSRTMMDELLRSAIVAFVPRSRFVKLGEMRFSSKVAPGFEDSSKHPQHLGDFFVWSDFLYAARSLYGQERLPDGDSLVFVTDDAKPDWVTGGSAHPTLAAEAAALTGRRLEIRQTSSLPQLIEELKVSSKSASGESDMR